MRILVIDDMPERHKVFARRWEAGNQYVAANDYKEGLEALSDGPYDLAFLDHDLGGPYFAPEGEPSGTELARHIVTLPPEKRPTQVVVHTWNPAGRARMVDILREAGVKVQAIPFSAKD